MLKSVHATHAHGALTLSGSLMFLDKFWHFKIFTCLDSESLVRGGPALTMFYFLLMRG